MTSAAATAANTIHPGDYVLYHGSITKLHGQAFMVTRAAGGTLHLTNGNLFIGQNILEGVRLASVTKI